MQGIKKLTLKPVISPITSQEKVTYSSSNKKIATVNSSGVITGKKKGTAYITVKSGKIRKKVKVVVK
ncbi:Ig-like domain-containing protein [Blautia sp. MB18-30]|uniref:Ig-like domain-containing protein n=1 Tax=Blautia sp. MB18-30 TaxID=2949744 RepID=UPI00202E8D5D|nr:Ig-like domain-containing protein [Blautia sp. MB18-30]MCM1904438.1 Ig-like domain-containing protein [Blautia sp. MB18-30]